MTEDRIMAANATAWIVNWICVVLIFVGLVVVSNQMATTTQLRNEQIKQLMALNREQDAAIDRLVPHVLQVEKILRESCGWKPDVTLGVKP